MAQAERRLTKQELMDLMAASNTQPAYGGYTEQQARALPSYLPQDVDPGFPVIPAGQAPSVASQVSPDAGLSAEQMRHSLAQMQPAAPVAAPASAPAAATAPMAPPLAGAEGQGPAQGSAAVSGDYNLSQSPGAGSYASRLALGETQGGGALADIMGRSRLESANLASEGVRKEAAAEQKGLEVERQRANEQQKIDQEAAATAKNQEDAQKVMAQRAQRAADEQMMRVSQAADEASQARVHNFWEDKSAGSRVLGVLAQLFAGAANGLSGNPSAPTPLDRIIARDLEMQQLNLQQKNRNVENQRSVLRDLFEKTGSQQQANAAFYMAAWKRIEAQGNALKNKFANETADAAMDKLQGVVDQRVAEIHDKTASDMFKMGIQQQQHGINILAETERTDSEAAGRAAVAQGQAAGKDRFILPGFKGTVAGDTYKNYKDATEGYTAVMSQARAIQQVAIDYREGRMNEAEAIQQYNAARSLLLTAQRKIQGTGAALSEAEAANLEKVLPQLGRHFLLPAAFDADLEHQAERITAASSRSFFAHIHGHVAGLELNDEDPEYGRAVKSYRTELVRQHRSGVR